MKYMPEAYAQLFSESPLKHECIDLGRDSKREIDFVNDILRHVGEAFAEIYR